MSFLPTFQVPLLPHTNRNETTPILQTLRALGIKAILLPYQDIHQTHTLYQTPTPTTSIETSPSTRTQTHTPTHPVDATPFEDPLLPPPPLWQHFILETLASGLLLVLLTPQEAALRTILQDTLGAAFMKQIHIDTLADPLVTLKKYQRDMYLKPHQLLWMTQEPTHVTKLRTKGYPVLFLPESIQELLP